MNDLWGITLQTIFQMHFLWKIILFSFAGIMASEIIFKRFPRFTKTIAKPIRPLTGLCRLPDEIGALLMSSMFVSSMATNTVLVSRQKDGVVSENQVVVAAILNTIPAYIRRILVFILPVFVPLFGWTFFLGIVFSYALIVAVKIIFCAIYGRIIYREEKCVNKEKIKKMADKAGSKIPKKDSFKKPLKMFFRMTTTLLITTFLAFFLINVGVLGKAAEFLLNPIIKLAALPESFGAPLMVFSTGSVVAGGGVFKNLMSEGAINLRKAFIGVLLGMIISQPAVIIRYVLPSYLGVFGKKIAFKIIMIASSIIFIVRILTFLAFKSVLL